MKWGVITGVGGGRGNRGGGGMQAVGQRSRREGGGETGAWTEAEEEGGGKREEVGAGSSWMRWGGETGAGGTGGGTMREGALRFLSNLLHVHNHSRLRRCIQRRGDGGENGEEAASGEGASTRSHDTSQVLRRGNGGKREGRGGVGVGGGRCLTLMQGSRTARGGGWGTSLLGIPSTIVAGMWARRCSGGLARRGVSLAAVVGVDGAIVGERGEDGLERKDKEDWRGGGQEEEGEGRGEDGQVAGEEDEEGRGKEKEERRGEDGQEEERGEDGVPVVGPPESLCNPGGGADTGAPPLGMRLRSTKA